MRIGQADIDFDTHKINGPTGNHSVEPKVMEVLSVLVDNAGQVVTRESLIDQVWGVGYGGDERLSRAISLLRKSLGDKRGKRGFIQTISKRGYKLRLDVDQPSHDRKTDPVATETMATGSTKPKRKTLSGFIAVFSVAAIALVALFYFNNKIDAVAPKPPLIIIMDSAHPARVYDEEVRLDGATNADVLSDILADLPIRTQKELISPSWHRYEAITQFDPDLIVVHYSGFKQEDSSGDRPQIRLLVEYFLHTDTQFLVYSRAGNDWLDGNMNIVLEELYAQNPALKDRISIFPLLEYGEPNWKDHGTSQGIKLKIKDLLSLE